MSCVNYVMKKKKIKKPNTKKCWSVRKESSHTKHTSSIPNEIHTPRYICYIFPAFLGDVRETMYSAKQIQPY